MKLKTLGERLKELRTERNISLGKLGETVNITASTLGDYENDRKNPTIERLKWLADFYGVSIDYLAGLSEVKTYNLSTQSIYSATGLSEEAIKSLINNNKSIEKLMFLNDLLEDVETLHFLSGAYYELKKFRKLAAVIEKIEYDSPIVLEQKVNEEFKLFRCQNLFADFLKKSEKGKR